MKSQPQSSCEFDSPAGDELELFSWQEDSWTADELTSEGSKQARAQNGTCVTKSAVTSVMSLTCRFTWFANPLPARESSGVFIHSFAQPSRVHPVAIDYHRPVASMN